MPKYTVTAPTFINGRMYAVGAVVEYEGNAGSTLEPADAAAHKAKSAYLVSRGQAPLPPYTGEPSRPIAMPPAINKEAAREMAQAEATRQAQANAKAAGTSPPQPVALVLPKAARAAAKAAAAASAAPPAAPAQEQAPPDPAADDGVI